MTDKYMGRIEKARKQKKCQWEIHTKTDKELKKQPQEVTKEINFNTICNKLGGLTNRYTHDIITFMYK